MKIQDNLVHPEDNSNVSYWSKKWGVSIRQLNDAILYTGSLNPVRLREYLKKDNWYHTSLLGLAKLFRSRGVSVH
ncbi:MAG: DUF3606 domain-containing protein [Bacteroidota bacterium]